MGENSQLAKLLSESLRATKNELSEAQVALGEAQKKVAALLLKADTFSRALAIETGRGQNNSSSGGPVGVDVHGEGMAAGVIKKTKTEGQSKSDLVRDLARKNEGSGITARDVMDLFERAGIEAHHNLGYSILSRLKGRGELKEMQGRYYPARANM